MKIIKSLLILAITFVSLNTSAQNHAIDIEISDLANQDIYLGYYYGNKTYVKDTITLDAKGQGTFKGDSLLEQGLYIIVMPSKSYFDVIVGEDQVFSLKTNSNDLVTALTVKGSDENVALKNFQEHMTKENKRSFEMRERLKVLPQNSDSIKIYQDQLKKLSDDIKVFWDNTIEHNKNNVLGILVKTMKNPDIPEFTVPDHITNKDSARWFYSYNYNRDHYFDFVDFSDNRYLRTPIFHNKVENFFTKIIIQNPDTINIYLDEFFVKAEKDEEMLEYWLRHFIVKYQQSNIMGMDKVFLHIGVNHILPREIDWLSEETMDKIRTETSKLRYNQIGSVAQDLKMETVDKQYARLHEINAKFTLVYFYEPSCGHCKKTTPKVFEIYNEFSRDEFEVFAVYTQAQETEWREYIIENGYDEWINVWDNYNLTNFRYFYNISSTPSLYLLDENKKIVAKRISADTLKEILDLEFGRTTIEEKIEKERTE